MNVVSIFGPFFLLLGICYLSGIFMRALYLNKAELELNNHWWISYVYRLMAIWGRWLVYSLLLGILLLWIDGFVKLPKSNLLFKLIQYLSTIAFGFGVSLFQSYFVGLGFLTVPFTEKAEITPVIREKFEKRAYQIAIIIVFCVLFISVLMDVIGRLFF